MFDLYKLYMSNELYDTTFTLINGKKQRTTRTKIFLNACKNRKECHNDVLIQSMPLKSSHFHSNQSQYLILNSAVIGRKEKLKYFAKHETKIMNMQTQLICTIHSNDIKVMNQSENDKNKTSSIPAILLTNNNNNNTKRAESCTFIRCYT